MEPIDLFKDFTPEEIKFLASCRRSSTPEGNEARRGSMRRHYAGLSKEDKKLWIQKSFHRPDAIKKSQETHEAFRDIYSNKQSASLKEHLASLTPEEMRIRMRNSLLSEESIKKRAQTVREDWARLSSEEKEAKMISMGFHGPEARRKALASIEKYWEDISNRLDRAEASRKFQMSLSPEERLRRVKKGILREDSILKSRQSAHKRPTIPEMLLGILLEKVFPGLWIYNGDGSYKVIIGRRIPDFVLKGGKKVIEMFGGEGWYHFTEEEGERAKHYKDHGWDCLVIWESEVWLADGIAGRVKEFLDAN